MFSQLFLNNKLKKYYKKDNKLKLLKIEKMA